MELTIGRLYGILHSLIANGHIQGQITVEDDGGLSNTPSVVWHETWGDHGQLEIVKDAIPLRGIMLHDGCQP